MVDVVKKRRNTAVFTKDQIADGLIGIYGLLNFLLAEPVWQAAVEAKTLELFVMVTSPDPTKPLIGSDLWMSLRKNFWTARSGIDLDRISREMAEQATKSLLG